MQEQPDTVPTTAPATEAPPAAPDASPSLPEQLSDAASELIDSVQKGDFASVWDQVVDMSVQFLPRLLQLILVVAITWIIAGWLKRAVTRAATRAHIEITLAKFFGNISRWMILIIGGIMVLGIFGVETTSLAAGLAAIGFAIGLALQGTLSNIASGIMLLILRPFRVGDFIKVNDIMGSVEEVELFNTSIDTIDNRRIVVPNSTIFGAVIENFTRHATRRVDITIGTAYSADLDATRTALLDAARSVPDRDPAQEPIVLLMELGSSSINWSVRIWCPTPKFWDVRDAAVRACKQALDAAGISIPFPQMDIHIQKWPGPPPSTTQSTPP